ncbi:protein-export chaperone SecB [Lacibacter sp. H407]|uniref:protein-export chaperone SecB n=1 Tax=Lacibacter sp. H407 TaxID=3133423 RepID=UPI0030BD6392
MKVKPSPLELVDFFVVNYQFEFVHPKEDVEIRTVFDAYPVEIDFGMRLLEDGLHQVAMKTVINRNEEQMAGYAISCEAVGIFKIQNVESEEEKQNLLVRSALAMLLNFVRTYISTVTSHYPMGKYWLPSIDVVDLIKQRNEQAKK